MLIRVGAFASLVWLSPLWAAQNKCTPATYEKLRPPKYPPSAVFHHAEGKALLKVLIGTDGVPGEISVDRSSGDESLDAAAVESIRDSRFGPMRCEGKPISSYALVPVNFSLADSTAGDQRWDVASDSVPMEFQNTSKAEAFFRKNNIPERATKFGSYQRMFVARDDSRVWFVHRSFSGDLIEITRWRQAVRDGTRYGLYTFLCEGAKDICASELASQVEYVRNNPMPPPPPLPSSK